MDDDAPGRIYEPAALIQRFYEEGYSPQKLATMMNFRISTKEDARVSKLAYQAAHVDTAPTTDSDTEETTEDPPSETKEGT